MTFTNVLKSVELNFTDLCNLQCSFCPHAFGFKGKNNNVHMTPEIARIVKKQLDEINFSGDVVISGKGEPTLNIYFEELMDIFADPNRNYSIKLISNGKNFSKYKGSVNKADVIVYDVYDTAYDPYGTSKQRVKAAKLKKSIDNKNKNRKSPHIKLRFKPDYGELETKTQTKWGSNFSSRGYAEHITKELSDGTCNIIFERLMIDWNGDYNLCCHDWFDRIVLGNIKTESILEYVEENPTLMSYRTKLVEGNRKDLTVCKNCDKLCPIETNTYKGLMDMYNACR